MQHEEKLLELMFDTDPNAVAKWIKTHPALDQADIIREYIILVKRRLLAAGDTGGDELCEAVEKQLESYQEAYLDTMLADLQYEVALIEQGKAEAKLDRAIVSLIESLRSSLEANDANAPAIKAVIAEIIAQQKKAGCYDPDEWDWFEEY